MTDRVRHAKGAIDMDLSYTTFTATTKAIDTGAGEIEAVANTLDVEDVQHDVMHSGCWGDVISKMQAGKAKWPTLCWGHDWAQPVGKVTYAEERGNGLVIRGAFNLNTTRGRDAYEDVKFGSITEHSVGFLTEKSGEHFDSKGTRHVTRVAQWPECSFVLVGASPDTRVMSIKGAATAVLPEVKDLIEAIVAEELTNASFRAAEQTVNVANRAEVARVYGFDPQLPVELWRAAMVEADAEILKERNS
jgi:HK97 family phage prohead protease